MLVDANLLIYAVDRHLPQHDAAATWLTEVLNGSRRVGLPWQTIGAFWRIMTHPRITTRPLTSDRAREYVDSWLAAEPTWIPAPSARTAAVLSDLAGRVPLTGNLLPDAQLAALALEYGLTVMSADTDFARFPGLAWENPLLGR